MNSPTAQTPPQRQGKRAVGKPYVIAFLGLVLASLNLSAASYTWNGGAGEWNTYSLLWNSSTSAWPNTGTDNYAIFGGTAGAVTVDSGAVQVNRITLNTVGYTIGAPGFSLILNGTAPQIITNAPAGGATIAVDLTSVNGFTYASGSTGFLGLGGNNSGLQGTINVQSNTSSGRIRLENVASGSANATWNIESSIVGLATNLAGITSGNTGYVELGALSGNAAGVLRVDGNASGASATYVIGALNTNSTFAGHVTDHLLDSTITTFITKTGTGSLTLSGANTYTRDTTVRNGTLIVGSDAVSTTLSNVAATVNDVANTITYTGALLTNGDRTLFTNAIIGSLPTGLLPETTYYVINQSGNTFQVSLTPGGSAIDLIGTGTNVRFNEAGSLGSTTSTILVGGGLTTSSDDLSLLINGAHTIERAVTVNNVGNSTTLGGNSDHASRFSGNIALAKTANLQSVTTGANDVTFSGVLSGAGGIVKTGTGTVSLTNANTFTGLTTVTQGTLAYGVSNALSSGDVTVNGGTLALGSFNDTVGAVTLTSGSITSSTGVLTGTSYAVESGSVSAILAGAVNLTKTTGGTVTLTGANTYSGTTTLTAGVLQAGNNAAFGTSALALNGGTLSSDSGTSRAFSNAVTFGGNVILGNGTQNGVLTFNGAGTLTGNRTITTASNVTYAGAIGETGGARSLTKAGAGELTFSAVNTYTGATIVSGGTLILSGSGSIANSAVVDVASGATLNTTAVGTYTYGSTQTLKGNGTIIGNTIIQGTLAAGNSPGILTFANNVTLDGSNSDFEINSGTPVRGSTYDGVNVGGILTYDGTLTLTMTALIGNGTYDLFSFTPSHLGNFDSVVFDGAGYTGTFAFNSGVWTATSNDQIFSFGLANGDLIVSAIPEPSTTLLLAGALTALVIFRRRRA